MIVKLSPTDYLNTDHIQRATVRNYRVLDSGAGGLRREYPVPEHLWVKMSSGEVLEFTGERMRVVLEALG